MKAGAKRPPKSRRSSAATHCSAAAAVSDDPPAPSPGSHWADGCHLATTETDIKGHDGKEKALELDSGGRARLGRGVRTAGWVSNYAGTPFVQKAQRFWHLHSDPEVRVQPVGTRAD